MLYHSTDNVGITIINPTKLQMRELIERLDEPEIKISEYPDISLTNHTCGWSISLFPSGIAALENLEKEDKKPSTISGVTRDEAFKMWLDLSIGATDAILSRDWKTQKH